MKTILTILGIAVVAIILFFTLGGDTADAPTDTATSTDEAATTSVESTLEDGQYEIDSDSSTVSWQAEKSLVDGYLDNGFIPVSGSIDVTNGAVSSSSITFDMTGITATGTSNTQLGVDRLTSHLRSDDFFAVEDYPTASFLLTNVEAMADANYQVTGDLTIKDQTNEISFPAEIGMADGQLVVQGDTIIDRTQWGVRYGSDSFFDNLGDNVIGDEVSISIDLVANSN